MSTEYMTIIRGCIEGRADAVIAHEKAEREAITKAPFYAYPASYARDKGELSAYHASRKANIACKDAIEKAIVDTWDGMHAIPLAAHSVLRDFGKDRVEYVLASTLLSKQADTRFSRDNMIWARSISMFEPEERRFAYAVKSHSAKLDSFVDRTREEIHLNTPLSKDEIRAEAQRILESFQTATEPNSPDKSHYMAELSQDFQRRFRTRDSEQLMKLLPFQSLCMSSLKDRKGMYLFISKNENRSQSLRLRKPSIKAQLAEKPERSGSHTTKARERGAR